MEFKKVNTYVYSPPDETLGPILGKMRVCKKCNEMADVSITWNNKYGFKIDKLRCGCTKYNQLCNQLKLTL